MLELVLPLQEQVLVVLEPGLEISLVLAKEVAVEVV